MSVSYAQMTKEEVFSVLSLEGLNNVPVTEDWNVIYNRYLDLVSYQPHDFFNGIAYSALSGIGEGAVESKEFNYKHSGWLPASLRNWFNSSPVNFGNPSYKLFGWQEFWREVDYASDREAYSTLKIFFKGKWYLAFPVHWIIKNTFATIIRDKFRYDNFLFSFQFDLIISLRH